MPEKIPPTLGRTVLYTLSVDDAAQINKRRADRSNHVEEQMKRTGAIPCDGSQSHIGNSVEEGEEYAMVIVRVWPHDSNGVNGKVLLDGNDDLWVTSVAEGSDPSKAIPRSYRWAPRVEAPKPLPPPTSIS